MNISIIEFIAYASFSLGYVMESRIISKGESWGAGKKFFKWDIYTKLIEIIF